MPAPATVDEFVELCLKSGIVGEPQLEALASDTPADPAMAAKTLIRTGALTKFQASQLLLGKYKGLRFDRLKIRDRIGSGGMGTVFLCEHLGLGKNVAVKMLPPNMASDTGRRERFFREARAVASLDHPNIIRVFDMNHCAGVHYIVMEYVEGQDLQSILTRHGPLPHRRACAYIAQVALGLQHAHEKGMIHRDIKPANLLADAAGTVKILDMGLACFPEDKADNITERYNKGAVLGTAAYMAPEQVVSSSTVDIRADIYSLGMTLYALLNGEPPPDESDVRTAKARGTFQIPSLSTINRNIPAALSAVVDKMVAEFPEDRYQSAAEVVGALTPWLEAETATIEIGQTTVVSMTVEPPPRVTAPPLPARKRSKRPVSLAIVAALLLATGSGVYLSSGEAKPAAVVEAKAGPPARQAAIPAKVKAPAAPRFQASSITILEAARCPEGSALMRGDEDEARKLLPPEWFFHVWKPESNARLKIDTHNGSKVIAITTTEGEPAAQLMTKASNPVASLKARRGYRLAVEYASKFAGKNRVGGVDLRFVDHTKPGLIGFDLPATGGRWKTAAVSFRSPIDSPLIVFLSQFSPAGEDTMMIRSMTLAEIDPETRDPLDDDFTTAADATVRIKHGETTESIGELPIGYQGRPGEPGGYAEFGVSMIGDRKALTLRPPPWGRASVIITSPRFAADRTREYRADLEYRAEASSAGQLKIDDGAGRSRWIADLPPTNGQWKTLSVPVWPTLSHPLASLELHNSGTGKENRLAIRRLAVRDLGPPPPMEASPVIRLQPDAPAKIRLIGKQPLEKTGDLPAGFGLSNQDAGSTTELDIGEFDGSSAVRITNIYGKSSALLSTPMAAAPDGEEYFLRVEYKADAQGAPAALVKLFSEQAPGIKVIGEMNHTNGAWRELRTRFRTSQPGERFRVEIHPLSAGKDKPLLIRTLEVQPYQPPVAGTWITLAKLEAATEKTFRLETIKGISQNTLLNIPVPAGWNGDSWKDGDRGSFTCESFAGRPAFTLLNAVGSESVQMYTHQPVATLKKGEQCVVKVVYFAEEKVRGIIEHRNGMDGEEKISTIELASTAGDWKTLEIELNPTADCPLYAFIQNHSAGPKTRLAIASHEVMVRRAEK
ncbi:serine/threonine-protein kinase [Zavarzinella formosa]|uniref:serine/threonine-protein kinase n=1 Tax=Zavarzinella formosa TaxID=360055 RepID=UPI0002DBDB82|nr:serine/threonine-protein kinase [Zavarzinella formosa]